jgi:hypothetical protein
MKVAPFCARINDNPRKNVDGYAGGQCWIIKSAEEPDFAIGPTVTPTRVRPCCGTGRMVVIAEFPPGTPADPITADLEPCLVLDSS